MTYSVLKVMLGVCFPLWVNKTFARCWSRITWAISEYAFFHWLLR